MTTNLYFYNLPVNLLNKNFIMDSWETYLGTLTPLAKTSFQFLRFDVDKTIKVNMGQEYSLNNITSTTYNYLKVTCTPTNNVTSTYYYFIKNIRQVSESTLEFSLRMDVLNTFKFSSATSITHTYDYNLAPESLIKREHKDRLTNPQNNYRYTIYEDVTLMDTRMGNQFTSLSGTIPSAVVLIYVRFKLYLLDMLNDPDYLSAAFPCTYELNDGIFNLIIAQNGVLIRKSQITTGRITFLIDGIRLLDTDNGDIELFKYETYSPTQYEWIFEYKPTVRTTTNTISYNSATWDIIKKYCPTALVPILGEKTRVYYNIVSITTYDRIIDQYQEGLSTNLFKTGENILYDEDVDNQWYVVYASTADVVTDSDTSTQAKYVNPVQVRFYSDTGYSVTTSSAFIATLYASEVPNYVNYAEYLIINGDKMDASSYIEYNGVQYTKADIPAGWIGFSIRRDSQNLFSSIAVYEWGFPVMVRTEYVLDNTPVSSIKLYNINSVPICKASGSISTTALEPDEVIQIGSGGNTFSGTSLPWGSVDLSDPKMIKAFAFPYAPVEFLAGKKSFDSMPDNCSYSTANDCLILLDPQAESFKRSITFGVSSPFNDCFVTITTPAIKKSRVIECESKLYHSDYYQPKFVYDSFAFSFNLEDVDVSSLNYGDNFNVQYIVSKNVVSKFAFIFDQYKCTRETQNYNNVLTIERNNEKALYNNAYLNYIRSGGYSYDTKKASSQNAVNGVTTALSIVGAAGGIIAGTVTGQAQLAAAGIAFGVGAIASIARNIHTAQEQDRAINQKLMQTQMQATSVQGSEDIDILTAFSGNKAKLVYYDLSTRMKQAMWDLFHYCGYATHEQKVPSTDTRLYFNYIQGDVIIKEFKFSQEIAELITKKWQEGVTFMHYVSDEYDWTQQYENYETSLMS